MIIQAFSYQNGVTFGPSISLAKEPKFLQIVCPHDIHPQVVNAKFIAKSIVRKMRPKLKH